MGYELANCLCSPFFALLVIAISYEDFGDVDRYG